MDNRAKRSVLGSVTKHLQDRGFEEDGRSPTDVGYRWKRQRLSITVRRNVWVLGSSLPERHSAVGDGLGQRDGDRVSSSVEMTAGCALDEATCAALVIDAEPPQYVSIISTLAKEVA